MTAVEVVYRYGLPPTENDLRALSTVREVYGVRRIELDATSRTIRVEYDASRLSAAEISSLLRRAGFDLQEQVALI
ncbi:MAG TPA: hypothetical protein VLE48_09130 [Terriglobales bacterium]|nr:hypothetical protein [Terriglobales bacterium]